MAKIYSKKTIATTPMLPKKETISLLLSYSQALSVLKVGKMTFENIAN